MNLRSASWLLLGVTFASSSTGFAQPRLPIDPRAQPSLSRGESDRYSLLPGPGGDVSLPSARALARRRCTSRRRSRRFKEGSSFVLDGWRAASGDRAHADAFRPRDWEVFSASPHEHPNFALLATSDGSRAPLTTAYWIATATRDRVLPAVGVISDDWR